jgi:protein-disulfide isomerase
VERFDREMADSTYAAQILKNYYRAINYGISGTPTTFINGELFAMSGVELLTTVKTILG